MAHAKAMPIRLTLTCLATTNEALTAKAMPVRVVISLGRVD